MLEIFIIAGCTAPAEQPPVINAKPVVEPEPIPDGLRWTPPLEDAYGFERLSLATRLEHCDHGECVVLASLAKATRIGDFSQSPTGDRAMLWYATPERESVLDIYALGPAAALVCSVDVDGTLHRPAEFSWLADGLVYSRSAGTFMQVVEVWSFTCERLVSLDAAQVFVADDLAHAIVVEYRPGEPFEVELVELPGDARSSIRRLGEHESLAAVEWRPDAVELTLSPGQVRVRVSLR